MAETSLVERTALKEWAVLVDAMGRGDVIAMVRKGGIREQRAGFTVRHERFLLYPTFFHEKVNDLAPRFSAQLDESHARKPGASTIRIEYVASVVGLWEVKELEALRAIEAEHGLSWSAVESRFHYKNKPGVQVVAVRVSRLLEAVVIPEIKRYQGCVSWVELDEDVDVSSVTPVLDDTSLMTRASAVRNALG
ncbi:MAG: hypothetical protein JWM41_3333 [Gemmatimonadetes bacterium]|nr:hypothetical protein [Gemmatimonadota bacterium]